MLNKSILNINTGESRKVAATNQAPDELSVQNIPVHSMKKDLEIIANPALLRQQETAPLPVSPGPQPASSTSRISPFLEKTALPPVTPPAQKKPFTSTIPSVKKEQPIKPVTPDSSSEFDLKKVFVFAIILLSVIALGIGSYYFWLVRGNDSESPIEEPTTPVSLPIEEPAPPAVTIEPEIKIEQPKENILVLDLINSTSAEIKTEIKNQIKKLPKDSFTQPLEFKLKDPQNNLLDFSLFAKKSGLVFAQELSAYLGESFSLLVFSDGPNLGTGLIIESKNDALLAQVLLEKEATLPKDLDAIFLIAMPEEAMEASFSGYIYKDLPLRYINLISPKELTVDYAVAKNKLIIGTTKNTFFALYDWLLLKSVAQ